MMQTLEKDNQVYTVEENSELYAQLLENGFVVREDKPKKKKTEGAK